MTRLSWSSADSRWTIERSADGTPVTLTAGFVFTCTGYYDYENGYMPDYPGVERYAGRLVHPQKWPEDLDYAGKRVVVIGSGATAVTLVPTMAADSPARHHAAALAHRISFALPSTRQ